MSPRGRDLHQRRRRFPRTRGDEPVEAAQTSGVVYGARVTAITYTDETADADHPTTWSATAAYTRSDGTTGTGRITLVPRRGGWQVDQWEAAQ